jgi:hypothetical protein
VKVVRMLMFRLDGGAREEKGREGSRRRGEKEREKWRNAAESLIGTGPTRQD